MLAIIDPYQQTVDSDQRGLDALFAELIAEGVIKDEADQNEPMPSECFELAEAA
jgi:hypothetical protein